MSIVMNFVQVYLILGSSECIEKLPFCCLCKKAGGCCTNAEGTGRDTKKCSQPICSKPKPIETGMMLLIMDIKKQSDAFFQRPVNFGV